jgi:hypothetical protein
MEDLKKKLQKFEGRGIQAGAEIQRAARRVVWENIRLRALLANKGISNQEVDQYLRSFDETNLQMGSVVLNDRNKSSQ